MANGIFTGIEIGAESIKVISLRCQKNEYTLLGAGLAHRPALEEGAEGVRTLASIIERIIRNHRIPVGTTVFSVSGRGSLIRYTTLPVVPAWKLAMLVAFEVEEKAGSGTDIAHDYHIIDLPEFSDNEFFVMLGQAHADTVNRELEIARLSVKRADFLDMRCLAPFNLFAISPQCREGEASLLLDIGAEETGLTFQNGANLLYSRPLNGGGRKFTSRIVQALGLTPEAAEEIKVTGPGILTPEAESDLLDERDRQISEALKSEASALCSAIQSSLKFFESQIRLAGAKNSESISPERIFITGGGSRLKGLALFMTARLHLPCECLNIDACLPRLKKAADVAFTEDQRSHFAAAAGLALSRARPGGFFLNLITQAEKERRRYWDKTVYLYASIVAAVLLLLVLGISSFHNLEVTKKNDQIWREAIVSARNLEGEFGVIRTKYQRLEEMTQALQIRQKSGVTLLMGIEILRNLTPSHIFIHKLESGLLPVASEPQISNRGRRPGSEKEALPGQLSSGVDAGEMIVLTGYCLAKEQNQASRLVTEFIEVILKAENGFFTKVVQTSGQWTEMKPEGGESLSDFFVGSMEKPAVIPQNGFLFTLECRPGGR